ncbi:type III secretion protein, partial [Salmonella bongori]|nr:type III secretion protein [Salmonella bongori]
MPQGESYKLSNSLSIELSLSKKIKGLFHIKNKGDFNKSIAVVKNSTDESNALTKNFHVNYVEDAASRVITAFMRKNISDSAYNYMFTSGSSWKGVPEMYQAKGLELMRKISKENINNLRKELQSLDHDEKSFLDSILTVKLRATHASNANLENENGVLGIYSRKLLIKK